MNPKLNLAVTEILKSEDSNETKTLKFIILAEQAYDAGDLNSYKSLIDEAGKLNPNFKPEKFIISKNRVSGTLPDIDFDN